MKTCPNCQQQLPFDAYYVDKSQSSGYSSYCRPCMKQRRADNARKNKERETARRTAWARANPERNKAIKAKSLAKPEVYAAQLAMSRKWKKENPAITRAHGSKYRAVKRKATVKWQEELTDLVFVEACDLAVRLEELTGVPFQVDHIIPLQGETVCGLHVWNNFQVLTEVANRRKRNHYNE